MSEYWVKWLKEENVQSGKSDVILDFFKRKLAAYSHLRHDAYHEICTTYDTIGLKQIFLWIYP